MFPGGEAEHSYPLETMLRGGRRRVAEVIPLERISERVPPHSLDAEMAVLGAMLQDRAAVVKAIELLEADCFYREAHRVLFQAIVALFERGVTVDLLTVAEELRRQGVLEQVGGTAYLTELTLRVPSVAAVEHYARIVLEHYLKRSLIRTAAEIIYACYDESTDALEELDRAESAIFEIAEKRLRQGARSMRTLARTAFEHVASLLERKERIGGIPTGYIRLDELTGGLQRSDFIVIAGRPSMGKTALALSMPAMRRWSTAFRWRSSRWRCRHCSLYCVCWQPRRRWIPIGCERGSSRRSSCRAWSRQRGGWRRRPSSLTIRRCCRWWSCGRNPAGCARSTG
jgi:hypothetical protein